MNKHKDLILEALTTPVSALAYSISRRLAESEPQRSLLEGTDPDFDFTRYAAAGLCQIQPAAGIYNQFTAAWDPTSERLYRYPVQVWYAVTWEGHSLDVLLMQWPTAGCGDTQYHWILSDIPEVGERFYEAVCRWATEIRGEILVFAHGYWQKDSDLFHSIQNASFENLILAGSLKQEIQDDIRRFIAARETYERYGIPWKRGILFVGPPGNGKTHAVKALINSLEVPCLYVRSLMTMRNTEHGSIHEIFKRARESTPCVLVLEDLDAMFTPRTRSYFLNELDGFAANTGIIVLATTNYPERLDPSILERPSRFDRKYHFNLPEVPERRAYLAMWNEQMQAETRLSEAGLDQVADHTGGFSFAYLKELFLSSMMRWINEPRPGGMDMVMLEQADALCLQMSSEPVAAVPADLDPEQEARFHAEE